MFMFLEMRVVGKGTRQLRQMLSVREERERETERERDTHTHTKIQREIQRQREAERGRHTLKHIHTRVQMSTKAYSSDRGPYRRTCVVFTAEPADRGDCTPKTTPDFESVGACWATADDILANSSIRWRGDDPQRAIRHLLAGKPIVPLSFLSER